MLYLEQQQIIHRDLALRNLLATQGTDQNKYLIKVADFGLSRTSDSGYYKTEDKSIPFKWTAPEALKRGTVEADKII